MRIERLADHIMNWAHSGAEDTGEVLVDRASDHTIEAFRRTLRQPQSFKVVERIELLAKSLWADVLHPRSAVTASDAILFSRFFLGVGFFHKHKPYGTKIASPFGYSVFDLRSNEGFSFQVHIEPKYEGFHVLGTKESSLVYISSREEWEDRGAAWAKGGAFDNRQADPPYVWRPVPGDSMEIAETKVVHSVFGCVLEEYASCSVDAVERLHDQNAGAVTALPPENLDIAALLQAGWQGLPRRRLERADEGWTVHEGPAGGAVIEVEGHLWGGRVTVPLNESTDLTQADDLLTIVVPVSGPVEIEVEGEAHAVGPGGLFCVLPGVTAAVTATSRAATVAVQRVSREMIQNEWTR